MENYEPDQDRPMPWTSTIRCIFCLNERPLGKMSSEHVFPEAIGGTYCIESVCKVCNDKLGHSVDHFLTDHRLIQFERTRLGLVGKKGVVPNPFGLSHLAGDESLKFQFRANKAGRLEPWLVPSVKTREGENGAKEVAIAIDTRDKDKIPEMINKILTRAGREERSEQQIWDMVKVQEHTNPEIKSNIPIDTIHFKRAMIKIVYEMACTWLGETYTRDGMASTLRHCMWDKKLNGDWSAQYPIRGQLGAFNKIAPLLPFLADRPNQHIVLLSRAQGRIGAYVRIFEVFDGMVEVTKNADQYPSFIPQFLAIDPVSGRCDKSTVDEEIARLAISMGGLVWGPTGENGHLGS